MTLGNVSNPDHRYTITYGPDDQRRKTRLDNDSTIYVGLYEKRSNNDILHYINGVGGISAVLVTNSVANTRKMFYLYSDHQGSLTAVADQTGAIVKEFSYDPWGRRRSATNWNDYDSETADNFGYYGTQLFTRGYTGQEHIAYFKLINMNGRMYDPRLARFLSPDNFVTDASATQSYNRYSFCINNPLKYVDPSGWSPYVWNGNDYGSFNAMYNAIFVYNEQAKSLSNSQLYSMWSKMSSNGFCGDAAYNAIFGFYSVDGGNTYGYYGLGVQGYLNYENDQIMYDIRQAYLDEKNTPADIYVDGNYMLSMYITSISASSRILPKKIWPMKKNENTKLSVKLPSSLSPSNTWEVNVLDPSAFVSQTCDVCCHIAADDMTGFESPADFNNQVALYDSQTDNIEVTYNSQAGYLKMATYLNSSQPIVAGVYWSNWKHTGNNGTADHYITISGYGMLLGHLYLRFFDPGTSTNSGTSPLNRLFLQSDGTFVGETQYSGRTYTISQIRPHD